MRVRKDQLFLRRLAHAVNNEVRFPITRGGYETRTRTIQKRLNVRHGSPTLRLR